MNDHAVVVRLRQAALELASASPDEKLTVSSICAAAGVSRAESPRIIEAISALPRDIAILMIEHDMDLVLRWAQRVVVLAAGKVIFDGKTTDVTQDTRVREAYLGQYAGAA